MPNFPKSERVSFLLRQDLADKLPPEDPDRRKFLNNAVERAFTEGPTAAEMGRKGGSVSSEAKKKSSAENGKKGGYWKNFKKPEDTP